MAARCQPRNSQFPALLEQVKSSEAGRDYSKSQNEQREGRQEFTHHVQLHRGDAAQEPPDIFAADIFLVHCFPAPCTLDARPDLSVQAPYLTY